MLLRFKGHKENGREKSTELESSQLDIFSSEEKHWPFQSFHVHHISVTHWQNNDNTQKKRCSLWVHLIALFHACMRVWQRLVTAKCPASSSVKVGSHFLEWKAISWLYVMCKRLAHQKGSKKTGMKKHQFAQDGCYRCCCRCGGMTAPGALFMPQSGQITWWRHSSVPHINPFSPHHLSHPSILPLVLSL